MDRQILVPNGAPCLLTALVQSPVNGATPELGSPPDSPGQSQSPDPTPETELKLNGNELLDGKEGSVHSEDSDSDENIGADAEHIPDGLKKRLRKTIDAQYEQSKRQFAAVAWAYHDLEDPEELEDDWMFCFRLLFGPENTKHTCLTKKTRTNRREAASADGRPPTFSNLSEHSADEDPERLEATLRHVCTKFFERHGLVAKIKKLPQDQGGEDSAINTRRKARAVNASSNYPSYHFVPRQRRHVVEQVMRCRSFLETAYNSCTESRNFRSPFAMFDPHANVLTYLQDIKTDLNDPDFSGLFISLTTEPFESNTELGEVRRTKLMAWSLVEIHTNNERCLKGMWVNPLMSANGTTDLLRAYLPFVILSAFAVNPPNVDPGQKKLFYAWLDDFDLFPRQTLTLLSSPHRFGLEKHFDSSEEHEDHECSTNAACYGRYLYEKNISYRLWEDEGNTDSEDTDSEADEYMDRVFRKYVADYPQYSARERKPCKCHEEANWTELDHVILACSEQTMRDSIPRWLQVIKRSCSEHLERDVSNVVAQRHREPESSTEVRDAEFTRLGNKQIQDMLSNLYGSKWSARLKPKYVKILKSDDQGTKNHTPIVDVEQRRSKRLAT